MRRLYRGANINACVNPLRRPKHGRVRESGSEKKASRKQGETNTVLKLENFRFIGFDCQI